MEQFDVGRALSVTIDESQPYRSMVVEIDQLSVVPGSGLGRPVIFGMQRTAAALRFRFLTEPSTSYAVHVTGDLTARNWVALTNINWMTLTNLGPRMEPTVVINDALGPEKRFYRIEKTLE